MAAKRFTVTLERVGKTATMFRVPFDLEEAFGHARPPVLVTIRDHTWRTTPGSAALANDAAAKAAFGALSFTKKREYVEWIEEAKRPQTRERRVAGTVERMKKGETAR